MARKESLRKTASQFMQFAFFGAAAGVAQYSLLICMVQLFHINAIVSSSAGYILGALINYYLNYQYTFRSSKRHREALPKFATVAVVGFTLNGLIMKAGIHDFKLHYLLAQVIATGLVLIWNYLANRFWTFHAGRG